nr:hypothetical protein [Tanacetum cinerariifolium]
MTQSNNSNPSSSPSTQIESHQQLCSSSTTLSPPGMILISKKLTGSGNYSTWKRSMMIALSARNKLKLATAHSLWHQLHDHYYSQLNQVFLMMQNNNESGSHNFMAVGYHSFYSPKEEELYLPPPHVCVSTVVAAFGIVACPLLSSMSSISSLPPIMVYGVGGRLVLLVSLGGLFCFLFYSYLIYDSYFMIMH